MEKTETRNIAIRNDGSTIRTTERPETAYPAALFPAPITDSGTDMMMARRSDRKARESVTGTLWEIRSFISWPAAVCPHLPVMKERMKWR